MVSGFNGVDAAHMRIDDGRILHLVFCKMDGHACMISESFADSDLASSMKNSSLTLELRDL